MSKNEINLNEIRPDGDVFVRDILWMDKGKDVHSGEVSVYFSNMEKNLVRLISKYRAAVGCVAWLTSEGVLKAMSDLERVSIVIQKEDFMRPDSNSFSNAKIKELYESLPPGARLLDDFGRLTSLLTQSGDWECSSVRWAGYYNHDRKPYFPRMHHKFIVLGDMEPGFTSPHDAEAESHLFLPKAVWTGSFNFTFNSSRSLENAVVITNRDVVMAYYEEWQRVLSISEPIPGYAWKTKWEPTNFRVGQ